jgi:hypothetical protein
MAVEKGMFIFLYSVVCLVMVLGLVSAALDLTLTGSIHGYSSDARFKILSAAGEGIDPYDLYAPSNPSNSTQFSSSVSGADLAIDSWSSNPRTLNLTYTLSPAQTGTFNLTWVSLSGTDYDGTITFYGSDSTYDTVVGSADLRDDTLYRSDIIGESSLYVKVVVQDYVAPSSSSSSSGGGGGGGGGGVATGPAGLTVAPRVLNVLHEINTVKTRQLQIQNQGGSLQTVNLRVEGLEGIVEILGETFFTLGARQGEKIDIRFIAPDTPGIYTGKIFVNTIEILVTVNVNTKDLLFDASIVVPDEFKRVVLGQNVESQVTLIPMGDEPRLDVTLNYLIKDFEGRIFLSESETILIESQKSFKKTFATQNLITGNYIVGLELVYPNGVAVSSSHFEVISIDQSAVSYYPVLIAALGTGIVIIFILLYYLRRRYKKMRKRIHRTKG